MPERIARRYCPSCGKHVRVTNSGTRPGTHFAVTLLTCGFWAPVWFLMWLFERWYCDTCGTVKRNWTPVT